jgi:hypothetical protein
MNESGLSASLTWLIAGYTILSQQNSISRRDFISDSEGKGRGDRRAKNRQRWKAPGKIAGVTSVFQRKSKWDFQRHLVRPNEFAVAPRRAAKSRDCLRSSIIESRQDGLWQRRENVSPPIFPETQKKLDRKSSVLKSGATEDKLKIPRRPCSTSPLRSTPDQTVMEVPSNLVIWNPENSSP